MGRNLGPLNIKDSYEGLVQISGSQLTDGSGSLIPSLDVTSSYATNAGYAGSSGTSGFATSASFADQAGTSGFATSASQAENANTAISASFATTASYALNVTPIDTGSLMVTGSVTDATLTFTKGDGSTFPLTVNNVANATSATLALSASHAVNADNAVTAQTASFLPADTNLNINSITASFASFTSASIGYLQTITGSAKIIGDAFIILNNNTPTERYAGLVVQDSGSTNNTASLEFDGQTNDWFYEYTDDGGATVDHGVAMFGPEYNTKGSPAYPTNNVIQKGDGGHHLLDSSITDDGTLVTINANVSASGYVSASSFIGDGSQLSGISTTPFPYTGSAEITGSLDVIGPITTGDGNHTATGLNSAVIGGSGNTVTNTDSVIVGGNNNSSTGTYAAVLGGNGNTANALRNVVVGGEGNRTTGGQATVIAGGFNNASTITQGFIGGGSSNTASGNQTGIIAGTSNTVGGTRNVVLGGLTNNVGGEDNGSLAGRSNTIPSGEYNVIVGGRGNTTGTNAFYSAVVGGNNCDIAGFDRSVVLGGSALASTKDDEVVVPSLTIYGDAIVDNGTTTGDVIDNIGQTAASSEDAVKHIIHLTQAEYDALTPDANTLYVIEGAETLGDTNVDGKLTGTVNTISDSGGTTALDCSVGNYFTLSMPSGGTTELLPSNVTAGQTINIEITQNATAATLTYDNAIEFPGGTAFTISTGAGEVDVLTLVSFDGVNLKATGLANFS
jgi:hypothetical protein